MDDFESNLNTILVATFNHILKYEEQSLKKALRAPLTITEAHMLEAVGRLTGGGASVSKIASALNIAMPTVTVALKKLESKGFITKAPSDEDGRRMMVSLTDAGKKIERAHRLFHERMVRNLSRQFSGGEKEVLLKALVTLNEFFRVKVETGT
jgi:DNA-binding MarR family transcriptional regulator